MRRSPRVLHPDTRFRRPGRRRFVRLGATSLSPLTLADWSRVKRSLCLSPRESEIVQRTLIDEKEGLIALHLGISCHTVHTHLERLYHKLHVNSRVGLVVRVLQEFVRLAAVPAAPADGVRSRVSPIQPTAD